jgi:hypothetical protein
MSLSDCSVGDTETYEAAVSLLNYLGACSCVGQVLRFPALVRRRFVEMVENQDPRALTMVGYFFMMLKKVDKGQKDWWLRDIIESEFKSLMVLLPRSWWPKMELATSVFEEPRIDCNEVVMKSDP